MQNILPSEIAEAVKALRKSLGLSQAEFSKRLGVGIASLKRWELAEYHPGPDALLRLYREARDSGIGDSAAEFTRLYHARGNSGTPRSSNFAVEALPDIADAIKSARADLEAATYDNRLTAAERRTLITRAIDTLGTGTDIIGQVLADAGEIAE